MFENLRRDAARYAAVGGWPSNPGFWLGAVYRFGVWGDSLPAAVLRIPVRILYRLARFPLRHLFNVDLWASRSGSKIGAGLCLIHPNNIVIGSGVEIGTDCLIFHEVTLGTGPVPGFPKIGNHVDIYVGARILGGVTVGDNSMIGANCVVTGNVPSGSVVLAAPSQVIPQTLSPVASRAAAQKQGQTAAAHERS